MTTQPTALDLYIKKATAVHAKLVRLRQLADNHFGHDPDHIDWGHVGDMGRIENALDDLLAIFDPHHPMESTRSPLLRD